MNKNTYRLTALVATFALVFSSFVLVSPAQAATPTCSMGTLSNDQSICKVTANLLTAASPNTTSLYCADGSNPVAGNCISTVIHVVHHDGYFIHHPAVTVYHDAYQKLVAPGHWATTTTYTTVLATAGYYDPPICTKSGGKTTCTSQYHAPTYKQVASVSSRWVDDVYTYVPAWVQVLSAAWDEWVPPSDDPQSVQVSSPALVAVHTHPATYSCPAGSLATAAGSAPYTSDPGCYVLPTIPQPPAPKYLTGEQIAADVCSQLNRNFNLITPSNPTNIPPGTFIAHSTDDPQSAAEDPTHKLSQYQEFPVVAQCYANMLNPEIRNYWVEVPNGAADTSTSGACKVPTGILTSAIWMFTHTFYKEIISDLLSIPGTGVIVKVGNYFHTEQGYIKLRADINHDVVTPAVVEQLPDC